MRMTVRVVGLAALVCAVMLAGCTKKVRVTVYNHSESPMRVRVTVPDGTVQLGAVSANGGRVSHVVKVKHEDFPAPCSASAGPGNMQRFEIDDDTPKKLWFHITTKGRLVGPYEKRDEHVEETIDTEIKVKSRARTVVD